jgi:hypothetical protein
MQFWLQAGNIYAESLEYRLNIYTHKEFYLYDK